MKKEKFKLLVKEGVEVVVVPEYVMLMLNQIEQLCDRVESLDPGGLGKKIPLIKALRTCGGIVEGKNIWRLKECKDFIETHFNC